MLLAITGQPASGKSSLSHRLARRLAGRWAPIELSIDDILRIQCPEGETPQYVRRGPHFLLDDAWRPHQMRLAVAGLLTTAELLRAKADVFRAPPLPLLELPTTELARFVELVSDNGLLVRLVAGGAERRRRNRNRDEWHRIPDPVFDYFDDAVRAVDLAAAQHRLTAAGWTVLTVSTDGAEADVLDAACDRVAAQISNGVT
jgi:hypothetical protein